MSGSSHVKTTFNIQNTTKSQWTYRTQQNHIEHTNNGISPFKPLQYFYMKINNIYKKQRVANTASNWFILPKTMFGPRDKNIQEWNTRTNNIQWSISRLTIICWTACKEKTISLRNYLLCLRAIHRKKKHFCKWNLLELSMITPICLAVKCVTWTKSGTTSNDRSRDIEQPVATLFVAFLWHSWSL